MQQSRLILKNIIFLYFFSLNFFYSTPTYSEEELSLRENIIQNRIKPIASVRVAGQTTETKTIVNKKLSNKDLYNKYCTLCHTSGLAGAPRIGNKNDWAPRIKKGLATLKKHALSGYEGMPAKGTCMECSNEQIFGIIEYMIKLVK